MRLQGMIWSRFVCFFGPDLIRMLAETRGEVRYMKLFCFVAFPSFQFFFSMVPTQNSEMEAVKMHLLWEACETMSKC